MKLLAILQLFTLFITFVPEGRMLIERGHCRGECGCSADARKDGTCCCSQATNQSAASERKSESCCSQSASDQQKRCCAVKSETSIDRKPAQKRCCSASKRRQPPSPAGVISSCPCGSDVIDVMILHAPRTSVQLVGVQNGHPAFLTVAIVSETWPAGGEQPATPPPERLPC